MVNYSHLYLTLLTSTFGLVISQDVPPTPSVRGSYRAVGEMVYLTTGVLNQVYFEENFDFKLGKSTFVVISALYNETFYEDTKSGKTWRIDEAGCVEYDASDWQNEHIPPDLKLYETQDGKPMFPIRQLLNLKKEHQIKSSTEIVIFRSIATRIYEYRITDKDRNTTIKAYWSDGSMESPSKYRITPVAFDMQIWKDDKHIRDQSIAIHVFFQGDEDYHTFEPLRGVFCPGLPEDSMFRSEIQKMTSFSFSSEIVTSEFYYISGLDVWMEPGNKFYRQDSSILDASWSNTPTKLFRIASLKQGSGTVYEIKERNGGVYSCDVKGLNDLKFQAEGIVGYENAHDIEAFFGFESTKYYLVGKVKERGVTCQLYHGIRTDWPPSQSDITTLWEWCIIKPDDATTVRFEEDHFPLVSLTIYITKSPFTDVLRDDYYQGRKFTHHFYNLHSYPNNVLETKIFDVSPCFTEEQTAVLQFLVSAKDASDIRTALKDDLNNVNFISLWKSAIYTASGLKPESLRLSKPVLEFSSSSNMTVRFHIMDRHQKITEEVEPITLTEAVSNIQYAVNKSELGLTYQKSGQTFDLNVISLTKREFIMPIEDTTVNPTEEVTSPNEEAEKDDGYSPGAMAGVAIAMLIIGGAVGAGIFVLKKKYYDKPR